MYCSVEDLIKALGEKEIIQLTDDNLTGEIDEAVANDAIERASSEIDGYLSTFTNVPLDKPPGIIKNICVTIALHNLYLRKSLEVEAIEKNYEHSLKLLEMIATGKIQLALSVNVKQTRYKWSAV